MKPTYTDFHSTGTMTGDRHRRRRILAFLLVAALAVIAGTGMADPGPTREYEVKAVFLYNFVQFTEWPASAFASSNAPISIGILGDDPFHGAVDKVISGETVRGRSLAVKTGKTVAELKGCQVIFVSRSERTRTAQVLSELGGLPILTVGEVDGFATSGGMVNFYLKDNKVRFEINIIAAHTKGLKIAAQLLGICRIVETKPEKGDTK